MENTCMAAKDYPRYRAIPCLDLSGDFERVCFLIQCKRSRAEKYMNCMDNTGPLLFEQKADAKACVKRLASQPS